MGHLLPLQLKSKMNAASSALSMRNSVYNFRAAIHAVAAGEVLGIRGLHRLAIYNNSSSIEFQTGNLT
jgi:hypothetical protein